MTIPIRLSDPNFLADPYRVYARLRTESPYARALLPGRPFPAVAFLFVPAWCCGELPLSRFPSQRRKARQSAQAFSGVPFGFTDLH